MKNDRNTRISIQMQGVPSNAMQSEGTYFLTTIPGLEPVTHLELCEKWGRASDFFAVSDFPICHPTRGGVEFKAPLELALCLYPFLRSNTRMLFRLKSFEAPHERDFLAGLTAIDWSPFFKKGDVFDFAFTSKSSKISMKNQVQKCLEQSLKPLQVRYQKGGNTIFVRLFRDQCNISLDCTGEAAFKRGGASKGSIASLRESTAHGLLRILFQGLNDPFELIDPMCGSGTFLSEALEIGNPMTRAFDFQKWPIFKSMQDQQDFISSTNNLGIKPDKVIGFDNNAKALTLAQKNLSRYSKSQFTLELADLFKGKEGLEGINSEGRKKVIVLNPPWGRRLPGASQDVLKAVYDKYQPDRIGLLMPARWKINSIPLEKVRDIPILNSGVENRFLVFA